MANKKKITPKQHGAAIIKMMKIMQKETAKTVNLYGRDDISQEEKNAIIDESTNILNKAIVDWDAIDKEYKEQ